MKVLIVGLGSIAQKHIHALRALNRQAEIFALRSGRSNTDVDGVTNLTLQQLHGERFDFAIISNPTDQHTTALPAVLELNVPLLIEKPLFHVIGEEERQLVEEINQKGILNYVACNLRFHPCLQYFRQEILPALSVINEVNIYCGSYLPDWRPGRDFREIYSANADKGGGAHLDLIHELDYAYWIFGKPLTDWGRLYSRSHLQISAVDSARYLWEYERYCISFTLNYYRRTGKRQIEVLTDEGEYMIDLVENRILFNKDVIVSYQLDRFYTYVKQMEYFIHHITDGKGMMNDVNEAMQVLQLCLNGELC
jgi:predicted dehydrogenase